MQTTRNVSAAEPDSAPAASAESSRPAAPSAPVEITPPKPISTPVEYPEGAQGAASVELQLVVDPTGAVRQVELLSGAPPFREAALEAAWRFRFQPAERAGKPVAARIRYTLTFTPSEPDEATAPRVSRPPPTPAPGTPPPLLPVEIVVRGERTPPGSVTITREEARALPGSFGDPLRALEAKPGVVPIVSGLPAFFIRGAPPANVGFFFDGIDLPLLYHAFFGPSVLHPGLIGTIDFYPGAAPANYGRFAGPIVAVKKAPMAERFSGEGSVRLIDAGGLLESGPFARPRGCADCAAGGARAAGRYSYAGLVLSLLSDAKLEYWDYQAEVSYPLGRSDTLSLLAFGGFDLFQPPQSSANTGAQVEFHRVDLRWDRRLGHDVELRSALTFGYDRAAGAEADSSIVTDPSLRLRSELEARLSASSTLRAGLDARGDRFGLETNPRSLNFPDFSTLFPARTELLGGGYLSFELEPARGLRVSPGVRADFYAAEHQNALGVDPRIEAQFQVSKPVRLEHALGIAHQRPNFAAQVPGAQVADLRGGLQWALLWSSGVHVQLARDWVASASVFRNAYFNALDPLGGARDFTIDRTVLDRRSTIAAAGLELYVARSLSQRLGGFVSYTLSRSEQSIDRQKSPSGFDRPHVLQAALNYDFGAGFRSGARAVLYSGIPELNLQGEPHFTGARRGPWFFRLDLRAEKRFRVGSRGSLAIVAELLNATSTSEVVRLDCGEICRERVAGPVILPSLGVEGAF